MPRLKLNPDKDTYRVEFIGDMAKVQCFGVPIKPYVMFEEETLVPIPALPDWIATRVAVLCTMSHEPPTEHVDRIGRRVGKYVYWIFYEGEDDDGYDT